MGSSTHDPKNAVIRNPVSNKKVDQKESDKLVSENFWFLGKVN